MGLYQDTEKGHSSQGRVSQGDSKPPSLLSRVVHPFTVMEPVFLPRSVPSPVLGRRETQFSRRPQLPLPGIRVPGDRLTRKHLESKSELWLVAAFSKPEFELQEIVFSDGLILLEVTKP